jgi:type II secretory pathway component GspD/PulD (secretin)
MKRNLIVLSLAGFLGSGLITLAQTDAPAGGTAAPATTPAPADSTVTPAPTPTPATPEATPASAAAAPAAPATPEATPAPATNSVTRDPNAVIPLIVMDEVPLTDAIKNLARQAGLNYMLDPKINYGGIGPDGRPVPQPMVSLRWENLTPDQALSAVLNNYNLTIVEDPKNKIARITVKDPAAPEPLVSSIIQLKYADPTNMLVSIQTALVDKRSKVVADGRTAQLVLLTTEKEQIEVNKVVAQLDTPTKQVLIEARLVETSKSPSTSKGIDWTGTVGAQNVRFGNHSLFQTQPTPDTITPGSTVVTSGGTVVTTAPTVTPGLPGTLSGVLANGPGLLANTHDGFNPSTFFLNADGASAVLSFLNKDADAKILSTPRAVTLDNQMATLSVTRAQPIFATTAGTQGSPGGSQVSYTNLGTILQVTPRISANNTIQLKVVPEVSDVAGVATKTVAGVVSQADIFDIRRIETQVLIPSGNTLVMGGLISDTTAIGNIKVPVLGDIPVLGHLFRQESKAQDKKNLIIFITPTIVQSEDYQPTQTDFLKTKLPSETTSDFGAWDSGKPQDWSKLMGKKSDPEKVEDAKFPDVK